MDALWGQDEIQHNDPLLTFHEITSHYRLSRRAYPLPHPKLDRSQSITLRMLQTGSFPSRGFLSRISTDIDSSCPDCNESYCSLTHMPWQCPALPNGPLSSEADWEEALRSPSLQAQIQAIQRAQERAEHHGAQPRLGRGQRPPRVPDRGSRGSSSGSNKVHCLSVCLVSHLVAGKLVRRQLQF